MRKCKCKADMEFVGHNADGKYWCPKCGRYSQSYACHETIWKEPLSTTPQLGEVPSNQQVYEWLKSQNYQTDEGAQEYIMYFDVDMPKILNDYYEWRNRHFA